MTTIADRIVLDGLAEDDYHRHSALSSTGARKLLSSTPAHLIGTWRREPLRDRS
jgi:hypothetical protein